MKNDSRPLELPQLRYEIPSQMFKFVGVSKCMMCMTEDKYDKLARLLNEERLYIDRKVDFASLCAVLDADADAMDAIVREELGVTGEQWISELRSSFRRHLYESLGVSWDC